MALGHSNYMLRENRDLQNSLTARHFSNIEFRRHDIEPLSHST